MTARYELKHDVAVIHLDNPPMNGLGLATRQGVMAGLRRALEITSLLIGTVAVSYLAWWACLFTYESWEFNDIAQGLLPLPMWIPQLSFAFGSVLLWLALVDELVLVLRGGVPSYVRAVEERHARGDFSSDL